MIPVPEGLESLRGPYPRTRTLKLIRKVEPAPRPTYKQEAPKATGHLSAAEAIGGPTSEDLRKLIGLTKGTRRKEQQPKAKEKQQKEEGILLDTAKDED